MTMQPARFRVLPAIIFSLIVAGFGVWVAIALADVTYPSQECTFLAQTDPRRTEPCAGASCFSATGHCMGTDNMDVDYSTVEWDEVAFFDCVHAEVTCTTLSGTQQLCLVSTKYGGAMCTGRRCVIEIKQHMCN